MTAPELAVLIVNWNTRELTLKCLDTLPRGIGGDVPYEVIVVDNGSVDGSADALEQRQEIALIRNAQNLGFAAAVNQAYRRSSGEFVLLLNSDVELTRRAVARLVEFLHATPDAAGAAPLYMNPDGTPQPFHFRLPTFATMLANSSAVLRRLIPGSERRLRAYRMLDDDFSEPRRVPQPSASCLLLRRTCLASRALFDERFPIFFNDVQLARTLAQHGHELWVTPAVTVTHEGHASTSQGGGLKRQYIGSVVRLLQETEPAHRVLAYRALVLGQGLSLRLLRRPGSLSLGDLWAAAGGDTGPLPAAPAARRR